MLGNSPGVAVMTDVKSGEQVIVGVENRDGNANVKFHQKDTLNRILYNLAHSSRANTTYRPITRWGKGGEVLNRREIPP
ncbi:MAG: hypothetical protein IJU62_06455 [Muribaculaceae bacterium]|nr:hypothetical protein [Muribaculaceae bacterium]